MYISSGVSTISLLKVCSIRVYITCFDFSYPKYHCFAISIYWRRKQYSYILIDLDISIVQSYLIPSWLNLQAGVNVRTLQAWCVTIVFSVSCPRLYIPVWSLGFMLLCQIWEQLILIRNLIQTQIPPSAIPDRSPSIYLVFGTVFEIGLLADLLF